MVIDIYSHLSRSTQRALDKYTTCVYYAFESEIFLVKNKKTLEKHKNIHSSNIFAFDQS
jgi:hypothetical protein